MIHEDAAVTRSGELTAVVVHPVKAFDVVNDLPRLFRTEDGNWKTYGVERDVIFSHELDIANIFSALVFPPPAFPVFFSSIRPFHGGADVFDRSVEPDVEHFAFKAGANVALVSHRNAPADVASNTSILQPFIQPLPGNRSNQNGPVRLGIYPLPQPAYHLRLPQEKMFGIA